MCDVVGVFGDCDITGISVVMDIPELPEVGRELPIGVIGSFQGGGAPVRRSAELGVELLSSILYSLY